MQPESFLKLTELQWAGLSSLATIIGATVTTTALFVALGSPSRDRKNKLKNLLQFLEDEISENSGYLFYVMQSMPDWDDGRDGSEIKKQIKNLLKIDTSFWENNYQLLAELSYKDFKQLKIINDLLTEIKNDSIKIASHDSIEWTDAVKLEDDINNCSKVIQLKRFTKSKASKETMKKKLRKILKKSITLA